MDELQFVPSDAVWHGVEKQIAPRKKRRLLVWLPILVLLLGGAAWMYNANKGDSENKNTAAAGKTSTAADNANNAERPTASGVSANKTIKQNTAAKEQAKKDAVTDRQTSSGQQAVRPPSAIVLNGDAAAANNGDRTKNNIAARKTAPAVQKNSNSHNRNVLVITKSNRDAYTVPDDKNKNIVTWKAPGQEKVTTYREAISGNSKADETTASSIEKDFAADSTAGSKPPATDATAAIVSADDQAIAVPDSTKKRRQPDSANSIAANKAAAKKKQKFEWGIGVQAGSSNISQGVTSLFKSAPAYDVNSLYFASRPSTPSNSTGGGSNNGIPPSAPPSEVHAGFAYSIGAFISKPVAGQWKFMMALNYNYYSTSIQVGAPVYNASQSMYQYSTGSASKYTNTLHFVELPLILQKQFGKSSRFSAEGGLALSLLAGSRTLLYDASQKAYVTDKSYINKVQASLLAGFGYRLFPKSLPVEIGPRCSYGLSNMFKKDLYGSTHLFFAGVQAKIFLSKK